MIHTIINGRQFLLVQVPEDSTDFKVEYEYRPFCVWLEMKVRNYPLPIGNAIYPYNRAIVIGKFSELTEEQCLDIGIGLPQIAKVMVDNNLNDLTTVIIEKIRA